MFSRPEVSKQRILKRDMRYAQVISHPCGPGSGEVDVRQAAVREVGWGEVRKASSADLFTFFSSPLALDSIYQV